MDFLVEAVKNVCVSEGFDRTYWIGYSGGLDSQVLLHLLVELRSHFPLKLHAIHVHHGLNPSADDWARQCEHTCQQWQINFTLRTVQAKNSLDKSPEEFARELRYRVFEVLLGPQDILLTAHHQDDQAETMLLQMLRGSGPKGLAAMPKVKVFAQGLHIRPLLHVSRNDLKTYAGQKKLSWIEDESNLNINFTRNFLRHEVIPILKNRWPNVTNTLARVADHCAEAQQLLEELANQDLSTVITSSGACLSVKKLAQLTLARQRQVLRIWLQKLNFPIPSLLKIQQIQNEMLQAREDKLPLVTWENVELRRYRDEIYAMPCLNACQLQAEYAWSLSQPLMIPGIGTLNATLSEKRSVQGMALRHDIEQVTVRFRQGGEKLQLPGRQHHHSLKKLFQEWGVPPWERDRVPLIYMDKKLIGVMGFFIDEEFAGQNHQTQYILNWGGLGGFLTQTLSRFRLNSS